METASQVHVNHEKVDSPSQKQNTSVENHELASGKLSEPEEHRSRGSLAQNCQTIDCSIQEQNTSVEKQNLASIHLGEPVTPMIMGSLAQNCQTAVCSSQKENLSVKKHEEQNTFVEEHELASGHLRESVRHMINCSLAQNCQTIDCSIQEQNTPVKKQELASRHLIEHVEPTSVEKHELVSGHLSEPVEPMGIGSQNCQIIDCSSQKQNTSEEDALGGKAELDSEFVPGEPMETSIAESMKSLYSVPIGNRMLGSDSVDNGIPGTESMTIDSGAQKCQISESVILEQNPPNEKYKMGSEPVSNELGNFKIERPDSIDKCSIIGNSISKEVALEGKPEPELDLNHLLGGPSKTRTAGDNAQPYLTTDSCHSEPSKHLIEDVEPTSVEKHELVSGYLSEPVEPMGIGSQNSQITDCSSQKQNTSEEDALGVKAELDSEFVPGEPMETSIAESMTSLYSVPIGNRMLGSDSVDNGIPGTESMIIGSGAQKCKTSESVILEQNPSNEKYKMGSEPVSNKLGNFKIERPDAIDKCSITWNSISKEVALEGKPELDLKHVPGGPSKTRTAGDKAQPCLTTDSCHNEPCSEHLQGDRTETRIVGSDSIDVAHSESETMITDSAAQNFQTIGSSILEQNASEEKHEMGSEHESSEPMEGKIIGSCTQAGKAILKTSTLDGKTELDSKLVQEEPAGSNPHNIQSMEPCSDPVKGEETETRIVGSASVDVGQSVTPSMCAADKTNGSTNKESTGPSSRKRKASRSATPGPARALRPRSNGLVKPPEPIGTSVSVCVEREEEQKSEGKQKKKKRTKNASDNEFSKTRKHLRYLLTRIRYQHNFIDAYSGEGWKGQSVEKIKPEKELQRASSEILRCKRRIRELFEQMDSSCAEGRFQESLFDSEGQISSEDIFCAKCGSADLSADNDIILCDGICDRGFHQKCLEPPLLKEEIPPGDESWLCPGCDCKADCIELLNECQGTNLSIDDVWKKVFPEAADTAAGDMIDEIAGLPSDDSEDYEYNPDAAEVEEGVQSKGANSEDSENSQYSGHSEDTEDSDDSDFTSASDDLGVLPIEDQYLGLPSDDSEDDEYDPNAPDIEHAKEESSSSDFTSASDDFSVSSDANVPSGTEDNPMPTSADGTKPPSSSNKRSRIPRNTKESANSELQSIIEPNSQDDRLPISGKRQRERLDYKKLHDEAYGNEPSDSSEDDDEWVEADSPPKKKDDGAGEESSLSPKANLPTTTSRRNTKSSRKRSSNDSGDTSKRRKSMKKDDEGANSSAETTSDGPKPNLTGKQATASANKTLGDAVTQEAYGNGPSDSSEDDDEWVEADSPSKKKDDGAGEESSLSPKANLPTTTSRGNTKSSRKRSSKDSGDTSKRRKCTKKDNEGGDSSAETTRDGPEPNLTGKKATASANKTLGDAVTQRLYESFKENEYPSRNTKESLANELGLSFQQVTKWFGNARWSSRHSPNSAITQTKRVSSSKDQTPLDLGESGADIVSKDNSNNVETSKTGSPNTPRKGTDISADLDLKTLDKASSSNRENGVANICADLDHKTPDKASSIDREIVVAIPANSSGFGDQTRKKGGKIKEGATRSNSRSQTRSKKAVTPKDK